MDDKQEDPVDYDAAMMDAQKLINDDLAPLAAKNLARAYLDANDHWAIQRRKKLRAQQERDAALAECERWRTRVKSLVCTTHLTSGDCGDRCVLCEVERLRGALRDYANPDNWEHNTEWALSLYGWTHAQAALGEEES